MNGEWQGTALVPACKKCPAQQQDKDIPKAEHGYDAPASIGIILIGWLYGEGDFGKSVCLAVNCGEDSDCTVGSLASLLGIIAGEKGIPEKWRKACSEQIVTWTLRTDDLLHVPKNITELCLRIVRQVPVVLQGGCSLTQDGSLCVEAAKEFFCRKGAFKAYLQEDIGDLLAGVGTTVRAHFRSLTVKVAFDEELASVTEGKEKRLLVTFSNRLFLPQYLTLRLCGFPAEWEIVGGTERCIGLEHWHGSSNERSLEQRFTPHALNKGKYEIVMEISCNGRGEKLYLPLTFLNGVCL